MPSSRLAILTLTAAGSGLWALHTVADPHGWRRHTSLAADLLAATSESDALEQRVDSLRTKVDALQHRPAAQEHIARDELGWVRAGELIIQFDDVDTPQ